MVRALLSRFTEPGIQLWERFATHVSSFAKVRPSGGVRGFVLTPGSWRLLVIYGVFSHADIFARTPLCSVLRRLDDYIPQSA